MRETDFRTPENQKKLRLLQVAQKNRCFYCASRISLRVNSLDPLRATVDHFFPLAQGGRDNFSNVVLACNACNKRKGVTPPNLQDLLQWNELAKVWPHIYPVLPDRHLQDRKQCVVCKAFIAVERILEAMRCKTAVHTCSPECAKRRNLLKRMPPPKVEDKC